MLSLRLKGCIDSNSCFNATFYFDLPFSLHNPSIHPLSISLHLSSPPSSHNVPLTPYLTKLNLISIVCRSEYEQFTLS